MRCGKMGATSVGAARRGRNDPYPIARKSFIDNHSPIINHPSFINPKGFTLIELLVVIAVIALLMSILMPCLQRARKQAKGIACQSKLHQWGVRLATFAAENDGRLVFTSRSDLPARSSLGWFAYADEGKWDPNALDSDRWRELAGLRACPLATKTARQAGYDTAWGGTFLAWEAFLYGKVTPGSYDPTHAVAPINILDTAPDPKVFQWHWASVYVKGAANIHAFLDNSAGRAGGYCAKDPPPPRDAIPIGEVSNRWSDFCINRHDGSVNSLFLDSSVRKVGLKELWTLKWQPDYETLGPWTKAGGVKPEDWPEWMRGFKDY